MSADAPWSYFLNLQYAGDVDVCWYVIEMEAGAPGVGGEIEVRGARDPLSVTFRHCVSFNNPAYPMPCFSELVDIGAGGCDEWMYTADVVTMEP